MGVTRFGRVLVADDEPSLRLLVKVNLEPHGIEVIEASSGASAFELACEQQPDIVLLDVMLPNGTGIEVARALKDNPATAAIPIVFLSARAMIDDQIRGVSAGALAYVTKPFNPTELHAVLDRLLERVEQCGADAVREELLAGLLYADDQNRPPLL